MLTLILSCSACATCFILSPISTFQIKLHADVSVTKYSYSVRKSAILREKVPAVTELSTVTIQWLPWKVSMHGTSLGVVSTVQYQSLSNVLLFNN